MFQLNKQLPNQKPVVSTFDSLSVNSVEPSAIRNPQSPIRIFLFLLFTSYFLLLLSCEKNTAPVQPPNPQLTLAVEDVAVTEAWLNLTIQDRSENLRFVLLRDDSLILNGQLTTNDTTLYDSTLLPAHTYTYRAELQKEGQKIAVAGPLSITTLDTTSHHFTWQIDTIGTHSSVLHDVAIINENDIWAVGEIHTAETDTFDSLGNWIPPYNVVYWNGSEWDLIRSEAEGYGFGENYSIFAFSPEDVWIGSTIPEHWDGQQWTFHGSTTGYPGGFRIRKIWGTSSENLYFVGDGGNIVHYNGQSWQQFPTGLNVNFYDIWGATNLQSGQTEIFILGSLLSIGQERAIIRIDHRGRFSEVDVSGLPFSLKSVWFVPDRNIFVAGDGLFRNRNLDEPLWENIGQGHPNFYRESIRGNGLNDISVVGHFGLVSHFNGVSWYHYNTTQLPQFSGLYTSLAVKEDYMVAVGVFNAGLGIIVHGIRNH